MTRREVWIAGALTAALTLITLALLAWGETAGAQAVKEPPPDAWVLRIRELGSVVTPIVATIASTLVILWKLQQTHETFNSKMDRFIEVTDRAAYARGQKSRDKFTPEGGAEPPPP